MKTQFDPDFPPQHEINRRTAAALKLRYDRRKRAYCDDDGCMIRDRFGQPL